MDDIGHRERKKQRTRRTLYEAALRLFCERGYDQTTIAEITEAAGLSTRTFFSYFRRKDDVALYDAEDKVLRALAVVREPCPGESPVEVLVRAMRQMFTIISGSTDPTGFAAHQEAERVRLVMTVPTLQAHLLRQIHDAQQRMTKELLASFPRQLTILDAQVMVAVLGAALQTAAVHALDSDQPATATGVATDRAIELAVHGLEAIGSLRSQTNGHDGR